jgi:class 3 adenylate cyclase
MLRFATKILLLMLAITVGLSALVVLAVVYHVTNTERARGRAQIQRAINDYGQNLDARSDRIRLIVSNLMGQPEIRAYLHELLESDPPDAAPKAVAQIRDEIMGRTLQTELTLQQIPPAFHLLLDDRGRVLAAKAPLESSPDVERQLRDIRPNIEVALNERVLGRFYIALGTKLFAGFSVPLRIALDEPPTLAYFVGYEIDDRWASTLVGPDADLRVVIQLDGRTVARSTPDPAAEKTLWDLTTQSKQSASVDSGSLDFRSHGERFLGAYQLRPAGPGSSFVFALYSSLDRALIPMRKLLWVILAIAAGAALIGVLASQLVSRMLARPVEMLVEGTERIARGEFDVKIESTRRDELGQLARSFNHMAAGLEQRDLIKDTFGKFVDPKIVESMLSDPTRLRLGGERRVQTVLFADLENFTQLSERVSPEQLFRLLNGYLEDAADLVAQTHGIVDKFIGDGVVAFWGPPLEASHAAGACRAALGFIRRAEKHDSLCRELGVSPLRVRVGIATGELLVGNIGSKSKYNYTVMGDVANLASRLEGVNKAYGTQILVSGRTAFDAEPHIVSRKIDNVRVVGRAEPVQLFEVLGEAGEVDAEVSRRCLQYAKALELYFNRRWAEARTAFEQVGDSPAAAMATRCAVLSQNEPANSWDGVWSLDQK